MENDLLQGVLDKFVGKRDASNSVFNSYPKDKPPMSRMSMYRKDQEIAELKRLQAARNRPLRHVFDHECPACGISMQVELRGDKSDGPLSYYQRLCAQVFCDKCYGFKTIIIKMGEEKEKLMQVVNEKLTKADNLRSAIKNTNCPDQKHYSESELQEVMAEVNEVWATIHTCIEQEEDARGKFTAHIEKMRAELPNVRGYEADTGVGEDRSGLPD
jgi:hypothetical protein